MFISFLILIASVSLAQVRVSFTLNMAPRGLFPLMLHIDEEGVFVKDYYAHKGIDRLILDLRGNGGGDPFCASYLWAYLEPEALPYFEDHYGKYDTLANPVPEAPYPYRGQLSTLIDGLCFSTTGHFCGLLKYHGVGFFVGSETGATYTCTGNATYPALDETGIMAGTAREGRYTAAVKGMDPRRGIKPDYPVNITQADLVHERDPVLEKALELAAE